MRKTLLSIGVVLASFALNAQIFSASDSLEFLNFTKVDADGDGNNWDIVSLPGSNFASQGTYMRSESYRNNVGAFTPDNILVTPAINLAGQTGAFLSFRVGTYDADFPSEKYSVYVVSNASEIATATPIHTETLTAAQASGAQVRILDISSYIPQGQVYVAFRHYDVTDMFVMMIDDVAVTSTVGLEEEQFSVGVYPNPTSDVLNIQSVEGVSSVNIVSMDGKVVATSNTNSVSVSSLNEGMYMYQVTTESGKMFSGNFAKN